MQAQQPHFGDEPNTVAHMREQHTTQLQDAVACYLPTLYRRACRYVSDPYDAEDAVQDALLSAYKHLHQFKATAKMTTWLTAIVTNSALTQLRRRPRHSHVSLNEQLNQEQDYFLSDTLADARPNPEDECASSESHGFLMQFLSELSPSLQQAIRMRYLDGLAVSEAADCGSSGGDNEGPPVAGARAAEADDERIIRRRGLPDELSAKCKAV